MKIFKKKNNSQLTKSIQGVIVASPMLWLIINFLFLLMAYLLLPKMMIVPRWLMLLLIALILNGWFWAALLFTYLFRDQSHKFIAPNISASLGEEDGFITYAPMIPNEKGDIIEPQFTIRALSGFSAFSFHIRGRVLSAYPTAYETYFPEGGWSVHAWLRCTSIDQVAENVRIALVREGAAHGVFLTPNDEIWFTRTFFNSGDKVPNKTDIALDVNLDEKQKLIADLRAQIGELSYQVQKYTQRASMEAFKASPSSPSFREQYNRPPESIDERTQRIMGKAQEELDERDRRRGRY